MQDVTLAAITIRASDNARRAVCGLLTPESWHSTATGRLDGLPEWIRMEAAAARALAQWAKHPERELCCWLASGPWFVRVVKWARAGGGGAERRRILGRYLDPASATIVASAVHSGRLQAIAKPHHAGVQAAVLLAEAHFRAGVDLASVLDDGEGDEGDLARIARTRIRSEAMPDPDDGVHRVTSDASFRLRNGAIRGAWAFVHPDGAWEAGALVDGVLNSYQAELQAAVEALERTPGNGPLELCSDNSAVIRRIQGLAAGAEPVAADDLEQHLLERARQVCSKRQVQARWIPGHAGVAENWLADALAGAHADREGGLVRGTVQPAGTEPAGEPKIRRRRRRRGRRGGRRKVT